MALMTEQQPSTEHAADPEKIAAIVESGNSDRRQKIWNRLMGYGFGSAVAGIPVFFGGLALATVEPISGLTLAGLGLAGMELGVPAGIAGVIGKVADRPTKTIVMKPNQHG